MERKLIKQGGGGYTIYLPKKWLDKKGLKKSSTVELKEIDGALLINSEIKEKKDITIEITKENKQDIEPILTHVYRRGFNTIILKGTDKELEKKVRQITKELLLGFEITDKSEKEIKIENISEPTEQKYDVMLRKVFLIIRETQNVILEDFKNNKYGNWQEIEEMRNNQDKFVLFCRRLLFREKYEKDPVLEWELLTFLMHIQHSYFYLYKYAKENKIKIEKKVIELLDKLKEYFNLFEDAYYNRNIEAIHKINILKREYQFGECLKEIENAKGKNSVVHAYIKDIFRLIQIGTSPILSKNLSY